VARNDGFQHPTSHIRRHGKDDPDVPLPRADDRRVHADHLPRMLINGPPELPGLIGASV